MQIRSDIRQQDEIDLKEKLSLPQDLKSSNTITRWKDIKEKIADTLQGNFKWIQIRNTNNGLQMKYYN